MIETNRAAITRDNGKLTLLIMLDEVYVELIQGFLRNTQRRDIAKYIFASLFEQSDICGESGVHRNIEEIKVGDKREIHGRSAYPISASLNITYNDYSRLRRTRARLNKESPFPDFVFVGGGE